MWSEYPTSLENIEPGRPFFMLNYSGLFMKVRVTENYYRFTMKKCIQKIDVGTPSFPREVYFVPCDDAHLLNDDGHHVLIANLTTGELVLMSKEKPCKVY